MSSDHHHRSSYFKDSYGSSSKRYHSPSGSTARGVGSGAYYNASSKRSRSDAYGGSASGSLHTSSSSSSRYNDYNSSSSLLSNRYKPSSYYDTPGLKSSATSSKYLDDYKGSSRGTMKSSVRRIPPPLTPPSLTSKSLMKSSLGSSSSRPLPLMKVITSSSSGGGSHGRESYGGSRLRTAPPEHHSTSYGYNFTSAHRKPDFKKPLTYGSILRNPFGPTHFRPSASNTAFRKGTLRTAASVSSKIRRRAVVSNIDERKRKRTDLSHSSRRDDNLLSPRHDRHKSKEETKDSRKSKDSDSKETTNEKDKSKEDIKFELDLPDGEVAVVLEEVGGDSEEDDNMDGKDENEEVIKRNIKDIGTTDPQNTDKDTENKESDDQKLTTESDDNVDGFRRDKKSLFNRKREDRDSSPSSRALLKLYCKYCDVRHVTFREYSQHLRSFPHTRAMNTAVTDMRKQLSKQRNQQRDDQRRVEKEEKVLSDTTSYCRVCELNFRTDPKEHEANELHNEIKTLIYQRCDICEIDFRIWKVYLYHMAALEHVKRVAMKELKDAESTGENVKGTNLSQEELGLNLVEVRTVFFCNACVRYLPIKGDHDEARGRHCMTLTHIKCVEEFRQREKRIAERQRKRLEREEKEGKLKMKDEKDKETNEPVDGESEDNNKVSEPAEILKDELLGSEEKDNKDDVIEKPSVEIKIESEDQVEGEVQEREEPVDAEDMDEDEIELHAGDDVAEDDESAEDTNGVWNRRTRSSKNTN